MNVRKYYTYYDEFKIKINKKECLKILEDILMKYSFEAILRALNNISLGLSKDFSFPNIIRFQKDYFKFPKPFEIVILHKQASLTLFQLVFNIEQHKFGNQTRINPRDIFSLYILVNQYLENYEFFEEQKSIKKKILFNSLKNYQFTENANDLQANFYLYDKYYSRINESNSMESVSLIKKTLGIGIYEYLDILKKIQVGQYPGSFDFLNKIAVINIENLHVEWENENSKEVIPFRLSFINKYPLIKVGKDHLLIDFNILTNTIVKKVYYLLGEKNYSSFKSFWGISIAEPVIRDLLRKYFENKFSTVLKIETSKYQYGDFGIKYGNNIFLFEIKTNIINSRTLYTSNYPSFIKYIKDKFILRKGITQQVKRFIDIDSNFEKFCKLSGLDPDEKFTVYPVLILFDEVLQSYCVNWYFSTMFDVIVRAKNFKPKNFSIAQNHVSITCNELYKFKFIKNGAINNLDYIMQYSNLETKPVESFSMYLHSQNTYHKSKTNI